MNASCMLTNGLKTHLQFVIRTHRVFSTTRKFFRRALSPSVCLSNVFSLSLTRAVSLSLPHFLSLSYLLVRSKLLFAWNACGGSDCGVSCVRKCEPNGNETPTVGFTKNRLITRTMYTSANIDTPILLFSFILSVSAYHSTASRRTRAIEFIIINTSHTYEHNIVKHRSLFCLWSLFVLFTSNKV